jgi:plastocyanin
VDSTLSGEPIATLAAVPHLARDTAHRRPLGPDQVGIDNFSFTPSTLTVKAGTTITWINQDDVPHLIVNVQQQFPSSPVLDTNQRYSYRFAKPGRYDYFCSIHPKMQGRVEVTR